jgi:hypothetical protein
LQGPSKIMTKTVRRLSSDHKRIPVEIRKSAKSIGLDDKDLSRIRSKNTLRARNDFLSEHYWHLVILGVIGIAVMLFVILSWLSTNNFSTQPPYGGGGGIRYGTASEKDFKKHGPRLAMRFSKSSHN